jgi:hypothetical protein
VTLTDRCSSKWLGLLESLLGTRELGCGHHLHGLGDLLDALDRLEASLNCTGTMISTHHQYDDSNRVGLGFL